MILYAPIINPKVPAFIRNDDNTTTVTINFTHNRAIAPQNVIRLSLLMWQYNDTIKETKIETATAVLYNLDEGWVKFTLSTTMSELLQDGMYYKIQIAYVGTDSKAGPYSTVGIGRYVGQQKEIDYGIKNYDNNLQENTQNFNSIKYSGYYINEQVPSEIVYQYRFILTDKDNNTIQNTQWQIPHDSQDPMPFTIEQDLQPYVNYNLNFQVQTINGLILSKNYTIIETLQPPSLYEGTIHVEQDGEAVDNGYVKIQLGGINSAEGYFRLVRHCNNEIDSKWDEIASFVLPISADLSEYYWKDFTIEHGNTYTYAIQQYSSNEPRIYSERIEAQPITISFEHMFLSDGERQLRIIFNPKVSSFKETILEQKTDTIGSQFPFFSRNGHVRYKELPISGLISYWMDSDEYFGLSIKDLNLPMVADRRSSASLVPSYRTNLDDINFKAERQFKLKVLEWLNNGKPKLFRSPAEGNYIIRLMNVNLSPTDGLGRMLHTFNATGYEIAQFNTKNLYNNNAILIQSPIVDNTNIETDQYTNIVNASEYVIFTVNNVFNATTIAPYQLIQIISIHYQGQGYITFEYENGDTRLEPLTTIEGEIDPTWFANAINIETAGSTHLTVTAYVYNPENVGG